MTTYEQELILRLNVNDIRNWCQLNKIKYAEECYGIHFAVKKTSYCFYNRHMYMDISKSSKNFVQSLMVTNVGLRYGKKITKKLVSFKDVTNDEGK